MIDINFIREHADIVEKKVRSKGIQIDMAEILKLDKQVRTVRKKYEDLLALKNQASLKIAKATADEKKKLISEMKDSDKEADGLSVEVRELDSALEKLLYQIPNLPTDDVKVGKDETENEELRKVGDPPKFDFKARDHVELGELLDIVDTKRGAKVSGARFVYLKNEGALLELALTQYAMAVLVEHGFKPVIPPSLINSESMRGMGYLEHGGEAEIYHFPKDDLYLIGTAEQAIGPMHADEILREDELPLRYVGFSPCYRRESGAYGKDTRGMLRVHEFYKTEMFSFTTPEQAESEHEFLLALEEKFMQGLGLPYRVIKQCTGDLGAQAARKYDIEVWIPSENKYRETHSTSNCLDFQSRRLNTRYKTKEGKNKFVYTLNGTAFSGRPIIAIMENFQQEDGSVLVPEILRPYMHGKAKIEPHTST